MYIYIFIRLTLSSIFLLAHKFPRCLLLYALLIIIIFFIFCLKFVCELESEAALWFPYYPRIRIHFVLLRQYRFLEVCILSEVSNSCILFVFLFIFVFFMPFDRQYCCCYCFNGCRWFFFPTSFVHFRFWC